MAGIGSKFGISKSGVHLSLSLGEAQAYLNALKSGDDGAGSSVAGNAFTSSFPFITAGDIQIDESDKTQVAQRAALSRAIAKEIQERHGGAQVAGGLAGGLASFMAPELAFKNIGVVGKLGKALNEIGWAKSTASGVDAVSKRPFRCFGKALHAGDGVLVEGASVRRVGRGGVADDIGP